MHKIAIIDFGSQYAHLIARRIRDLNVYSEILNNSASIEKLKEYKGIILSGGPSSVYEEGSPTINEKIFKLEVPVLGICYGHQLMMHALGGKVEKGDGQGSEFGEAEMKILKAESIFKSFKKNEKIEVWMSHADKVAKLPKGFEIIASSKDDPYSAVADLKRNFFGLQFHPEVVHTKRGEEIFTNFLDICFVQRDWTVQSFIKKIIKEIQEQVSDRKVFMLVSGGVDSSVAYDLLIKALGQDRVKGYMIDTGLLRQNEALEVVKMLKKAGIDIQIEQAQTKFLKALNFATEPEEKRKIIGEMFLKIQAEISQRENLNPEDWLLGQGTIYPDTIESGGTKNSNVIKTHHNRIEKIQQMISQGLIIEPIKDLYKDEVRQVGLKLGLPKELIQRQPFPGPGLGVRILCNKESFSKNKSFENLTKKVNEFIKDKFAIDLQAVVLPIKSVGVQGDFRTYKHPAVLYGKVKDWKILEKLSPAITNKFLDINRVIYLFCLDKLDLRKIRYNAGYITENRIKILQKADYLSRQCLDKVDTEKMVWQMPVVLLPLSIQGDDTESIVLRPIVSQEAMTANFAQLSMVEIESLAKEIMKDKQISAVFYDITNKPPATIEWE